MPWNPSKPAGTDAASTIDDSVIENNQALDTWASALTDGITQAAASVFRAYRAANVVIAKFRAAAGDTFDRFRYDLNGKMEWGSGAATPDVAMERAGVNTFRMTLGGVENARWVATRTTFKQAMCRVRKSAGQTVPAGTSPLVTWDVEDFDTDTLHDNVTNNTRFTAPVPGKYYIGCLLRWAPNSTGIREIEYLVNGATPIILSLINATSGDSTIHHGMILVSLAAGDYVEWRATNTAGVNLDIQGGVYGSYAWMTYVGE